jgi:signal transduction histidine kinase
MFEELVRAFGCEHALLVFRDAELDRLFVWRARRGERGRIAPEILPLDRSDSYFLDDLETSLCWNSFENAGEGFGWNHYDGRRVPEPPRLPGPSRKALEARSLLSVVLEFSEEPVGRVLLLNGAGPFTRHDLRWLERIFRHLGPALENLFLLRHLRARAIEAERGRVSRDLHDGILQTILGVDMQLDVLLRQVERDPASAAKDLAALRQTLRHEGEELRRMVTDLRPLRVQSADLLDLMRGFAERYRNEAGVALDLLIESADLRVPDRVCRELFQIYREALHNIKKHARASHVVVKVWQDEAYLHLMVDDNGQGFSFAGRFSSDELDRLRLGPITIKERTRGIGGVLTVESNPGHGARLTIEVPLS